MNKQVRIILAVVGVIVMIAGHIVLPTEYIGIAHAGGFVFGFFGVGLVFDYCKSKSGDERCD